MSKLVTQVASPKKRLWDKDIQMSFDLANLIVVS